MPQDYDEQADFAAEPVEHDTADDEQLLGWATNVSQLALGPNSDHGDETAVATEQQLE